MGIWKLLKVITVGSSQRSKLLLMFRQRWIVGEKVIVLLNCKIIKHKVNHRFLELELHLFKSMIHLRNVMMLLKIAMNRLLDKWEE